MTYEPAASRPGSNVYACLVHEKPEVVIDLIRNLRAIDPDSPILLYDGSPGGDLLDARLPFGRWGVERVPNPTPMRWGTLHGFALDCIAHLGRSDYTTMTIVDSDQLALRGGYVEFLAQRFDGRSGLGVLSNLPERQGPGTPQGAARAALDERALWEPFFRRFPNGDAHFVHWTFWPGTVLFADAARAVLDLFRDAELQAVLARSKLWATEEVLFPTLAALLGFDVVRNPCRQTWVQFRRTYTPADVAAALATPDAFWIHPVPRQIEHPHRRTIRCALHDYRPAPPRPGAGLRDPGLAATLGPTIDRMRTVSGWLSDAEAELLLASADAALTRADAAGRIVEIGAFCGRNTLGLASVAKARGARVVAVDPFDGVVGARDDRLRRFADVRAIFDKTLADNDLTATVDVLAGTAAAVDLRGPFDLAFVDGLHDYAAVVADIAAIEPHLPVGAFLAVHDYAAYFPGVVAAVDELPAESWSRQATLDSLIVLRRESEAGLFGLGLRS